MKKTQLKKVIAIVLALTFTLASITMLAINVNAGYSYHHEHEEAFYLNGTTLEAGSLFVQDSYYTNSRCLYIHDTVRYTSYAITPYNLVLSGMYSFVYTDGTSRGRPFEKTATNNGFEYSYEVQSSSVKTLHTVEVHHYINFINAVSNYTDAFVETVFTIN